MEFFMGSGIPLNYSLRIYKQSCSLKRCGLTRTVLRLGNYVKFIVYPTINE